MERWAAGRQILHTTTGGDNPASAGHVESEVNQLKRRVRLYLRQAGLGVESWPLALRYSARTEKTAVEFVGNSNVDHVAIFCFCFGERKRWYERGLLASPFVSGKLLGPSPLMHQGWTVRLEDGSIVHVREAVVPSKLGDEVAIQLLEDPIAPAHVEEVTNPEIPPYRLRGKQSMPGFPRVPQVVFPGSAQEGSSQEKADSFSGPAGVAGGENGGENGETKTENQEFDREVDLGDTETGEETVAFRMPGAVDDENRPRRSRRKSETTETETEKLKRVDGFEEDVPQDCNPGGETVRMVSEEALETVLLGEHSLVSRALEEFMNQVPVGSECGLSYGDGIQWLTLRREGIEKSLQELQTLKKVSGLRLCGISPEELGVSSEEEVLQTMVVSLDEVRKNIDEWKSAMWNEYKSLTEETRAIEPVDASVLGDLDVELVPGKLVCTLKAGPRGGRKKCRAVICGNMLDQETDPCPKFLCFRGRWSLNQDDGSTWCRARVGNHHHGC